jgi:uncharacterized protein
MTETKRRGFAAMDPEAQRAIARKGGRASHAMGAAHEFSPEEAREAGAKGGQTVASRPGHMAALGRKGGLARAAKQTALAKRVAEPAAEE